VFVVVRSVFVLTVMDSASALYDMGVHSAMRTLTSTSKVSIKYEISFGKQIRIFREFRFRPI